MKLIIAGCLVFLSQYFLAVQSQFSEPDPRCPDPTRRIGTCGFCTSCPEGLICCRNGCGTSCMKPRVCPPHRPRVYCYIRPCQYASCPAYPGATCTDYYCGGCNAIFTDENGSRISRGGCTASCPTLDTEAEQYSLECSNQDYVGSVCNVTCPAGQAVYGVHSLTCSENSRWDRSLEYTHCQAVCPPGVENVKCDVHPCKFATCPNHPDAICYPNYCGGACSHDFYLNGEKLSADACIPRRG